MLDDLFNGILVLAFLALGIFGVLSGQPDSSEPALQTVTQLERVIITGPGIKAESKV